MTIGLLVFPGLTQLDLTGPYEVLSRLSETRLHLVWKTLAPVVSDRGLTLQPTLTLAECGPLDVLLVPGGPGVVAVMEDEEVLHFLRQQAKGARYVTSVCTGALVLGAAGLLRGYRATTHWASLEFLESLGAVACPERIVVDRNRITGGGVTAGIDFGLQLAAELRGEAEARVIQLQMEYNPAPPFDAGHPGRASAETVAAARQANEGWLALRRVVVERVQRRLTAPNAPI